MWPLQGQGHMLQWCAIVLLFAKMLSWPGCFAISNNMVKSDIWNPVATMGIQAWALTYQPCLHKVKNELAVKYNYKIRNVKSFSLDTDAVTYWTMIASLL